MQDDLKHDVSALKWVLKILCLMGSASAANAPHDIRKDIAPMTGFANTLAPEIAREVTLIDLAAVLYFRSLVFSLITSSEIRDWSS